MNLISGEKSENKNKVLKEVEDDFRAMNPVEVGDDKCRYYNAPFPALPNNLRKLPTTLFTTLVEFTVERERLLTASNTATESRALKQEKFKM